MVLYLGTVDNWEEILNHHLGNLQLEWCYYYKLESCLAVYSNTVHEVLK